MRIQFQCVTITFDIVLMDLRTNASLRDVRCPPDEKNCIPDAGGYRRAGLHPFAGRIYFKGDTDLLINSAEPIRVSLDAGLDTHIEWADARARHHPWGSRDERGRAPGTLRALGTAQALTLQCATQGCAALVHLQAARRRANAVGRVKYEAGDGCGSRLCSLNHRPGQFLRNQLAMALALESGERLLIAWPRALSAREVEVQPHAVSKV